MLHLNKFLFKHIAFSKKEEELFTVLVLFRVVVRNLWNGFPATVPIPHAVAGTPFSIPDVKKTFEERVIRKSVVSLFAASVSAVALRISL